MRQCILRRGNVYQVAWIPLKFAIAGKYVRIHDVDGWLVQAIGIYQEHVEGQHGYFAGGVGRP